MQYGRIVTFVMDAWLQFVHVSKSTFSRNILLPDLSSNSLFVIVYVQYGRLVTFVMDVCLQFVHVSRSTFSRNILLPGLSSNSLFSIVYVEYGRGYGLFT